MIKSNNLIKYSRIGSTSGTRSIVDSTSQDRRCRRHRGQRWSRQRVTQGIYSGGIRSATELWPQRRNQRLRKKFVLYPELRRSLNSTSFNQRNHLCYGQPNNYARMIMIYSAFVFYTCWNRCEVVNSNS